MYLPDLHSLYQSSDIGINGAPGPDIASTRWSRLGLCQIGAPAIAEVLDFVTFQ